MTIHVITLLFLIRLPSLNIIGRSRIITTPEQYMSCTQNPRAPWPADGCQVGLWQMGVEVDFNLLLKTCLLKQYTLSSFETVHIGSQRFT